MKKLYTKLKTASLKVKIKSLDQKNFYFYLMIGMVVLGLGLIAIYIMDELIKGSPYRDGIIGIESLIIMLLAARIMSKGIKHEAVSEDERKIANDGMKIKLENEIFQLSVPMERNLSVNQKKPFKI